MTASTLDYYYGVPGRNEEFDFDTQTDSQTIAGIDGDDFIWGGIASDNLFGGSGSEIIIGNGGDDIIYGDTTDFTDPGVGGNDIIDGGTGSDTILGGGGNDFIDGGADDDGIIGEDGADLIFGGFGSDQILGGSGNDQLWGGSDPGDSGVRNSASTDWDGATDSPVTPGSWQHTFQNASGDNSIDFIDGGFGNDVLHGQGGADYLFGGPGNDQLYGGVVIGALSAAAFYSAATATKAHDPDDRIVYNRSNGSLYYDPDGNKAGGAPAIKFAILDGHPADVASNDFLVLP